MTTPLNIRIDVYHDGDFDDAFYMMNGTRARDLSGKVLELVILPAFDHPTPIRTLRSDSGGPEIVIDDPTFGGAHFSMAQALVQANLPVGEWVYFLDVIDGGSRLAAWRGPFVVNAARVPA